MQRPGHQSNTIADLSGLLARAEKIAFLTGAGMSTESGLPDFRSASGIYTTSSGQNVFDGPSFDRDPGPFFAFARTFFADVLAAEPNSGHLAIAHLQDHFGKDVEVATQNIDTLHQKAGSTHVHPVHGTVQTSTCNQCGDEVSTATLWPAVTAGNIPIHASCGGVYKPDIVFFGEMLPAAALMAAERAIRSADLVLVLGTSLSVYPAALLPEYRRAGTPVVVINRTGTRLDDDAALVFHASVGEVLPAAVGRLQSKEVNPR